MREITLEGVDGTLWDLNDGILRVTRDPQLWGLPAVQVSERTSAALPGSRVTRRRHAARDLVVPVVIVGEVEEDLDTTIAAFARSIDAVVGDVTITVTRPDGLARKITATYLAGWDLMAIAERQDKHKTTVPVAFRAHDPFWTNVVDDTITISPPPPVFVSGTTAFSSATTTFNAAIPFDGFASGTEFNAGIDFNAPIPFSGGAGGVVVFTIPDTGGDIDVWPYFTAVGPATAVEAYNLTTGKYWSFPAGISGGETLIVDTRPRSREVTINAGNAWAEMKVDSELWSLEKSTSQTIAIRFDGSVDGVSSMTMSWLPQWLTS